MKYPRASGALRWALDPTLKRAHFACTTLLHTIGNLGLSRSGPPPRSNPGSAPERSPRAQSMAAKGHRPKNPTLHRALFAVSAMIRRSWPSPRRSLIPGAPVAKAVGARAQVARAQMARARVASAQVRRTPTAPRRRSTRRRTRRRRRRRSKCRAS